MARAKKTPKKSAKKTGKKVGRPTVDTPEVRRKIEQAAALDASVEEIAFFAGIHRDTLHQILKKDPAFSDRIDALRQKPILAARTAAVKFATANYSNAMDYLSRKKKDEFSTRSEVTGKDGEDLLPIPLFGHVSTDNKSPKNPESKGKA